MDDKQFSDLLTKLHKAHKKYSDLLKIAEMEYDDRYNRCSSDNDSWVDSFHTSCLPMTLNELETSLKTYK